MQHNWQHNWQHNLCKCKTNVSNWKSTSWDDCSSHHSQTSKDAVIWCSFLSTHTFLFGNGQTYATLGVPYYRVSRIFMSRIFSVPEFGTMPSRPSRERCNVLPPGDWSTASFSLHCAHCFEGIQVALQSQTLVSRNLVSCTVIQNTMLKQIVHKTTTNRSSLTDLELYVDVGLNAKPSGSIHLSIFTAWCYASAVLAMAPCLSVCPFVTSRCSTKTAKRRITQTTPHDSSWTLVFWCQRSPRNSTGVTPYGGAKCRRGGSKSATFDK